MFLVFSKDKIYTYIVSILTVMFLFFVAGNFDETRKNTEEASSIIEKNNVINETENMYKFPENTYN